MVNDREKNPRNFENSSKLYEIAKSALTSNIIISEYIELLEDINYDLLLTELNAFFSESISAGLKSEISPFMDFLYLNGGKRLVKAISYWLIISNVV